jgi:uncharacterized protein (TIGR02246 family)
VTTCVVAVLAAMAASQGCAKPADDAGAGMAMSGTAAGIDSLRRAYEDTYNRRDAATLASYYTEDATGVPPNGMLHEGRAAIQGSWPRDTALWGRITITPSKPATIAGNVAWETGTFVIQVAQRGRTMTVPNRYLVVLQHEGGSWKLKATAGAADSAAMAAGRRPSAR